MAKRLHPGSLIPAIDSGSWNEFVDASEFVQGLQNPTQQDPPLKLPSGQVLVSVKLFEALPSYSVVKVLRSSAAAPTNAQLGCAPVMDTAAPAEDSQFGITQRHGATDENTPAAISGYTWVKVDIKDAADEVCGVIDGDNTKLESGKGATPIVWKESGTGEKWAIVLLGGGGGEPNVITGLTTSDVSGSGSFLIDNITLISGTDPRPSPVNASQTVSVKNTFSLDIDDNTKVWTQQNKDNEWEAFRPGEGGDPGNEIVNFGLAEDLARHDTEALARRVLADGSLGPDPDAQTDVSFYVVDPTNRWEGSKEFTGNPNQPPYKGFAVKFTGDYFINGQSTGRPGYYILDMDTRSLFVFVHLQEDQPSDITQSVKCDYDQEDQVEGIGYPSMGFLTYEDSGVGYDLLVGNRLGMLADGKKDDIWVAILVHDVDPVRPQYQFAFRKQAILDFDIISLISEP